MPKASIVPVAKSLYVCDGTIGFPGGKTDIMGVFNSINAAVMPNRDTLVELALTMTNVSFPQSGLYLIELFCNNQWVADTTLLLK